MLWEVDIYPAPGQPDLLGRPIATAAAELGLAADLKVFAARGYLIQADWDIPRRSGWPANCLPIVSSNGPWWRPVGDDALDQMPLEGKNGRWGDGGIGRWGDAEADNISSSPPPHLPISPSASGSRAAQAGRDGSGGPERDVGHCGHRPEGRRGPHAAKILARGTGRRPGRQRWAPRCWPTTPSSK